MKKIRKGDSVVVLTGRDKGKTGTVTTVLADKLVVEGINIYKKATKPNPASGVTGGMIDKVMPIHISNVALADANGKASRVGIKLLDGKKVRYLKTTGTSLST
ncbi:MAG: 50S ribosomal protein L24 [Burkholderiales bacterium]|jgi:large subunit ribosomal protein L24|nr:50S ribosomal protein L24 [Polynucleobacter sp.]MCX7244540.1 50S ribosomal protein L24 [Burkholderiales bacterium]